jgi:hypothetical protein
MGVAVVLQGPKIPLQPGSQTASDVRIKNTGATVDQFELDVVGEAAAWTYVEPSSVNLMPGEETTAHIVFAPPRSSRVAEGPAAFALRVMSREDTAGSSIQEAVVDVAAFSNISMDIVPRTSSGRRTGRHQLALDNLGNHPELVAISAVDPDRKLNFRIQPVNITLHPGTATFVKLAARPKRLFWTGPNVSLPFQVTASPENTDPITVPATMLQRALLPSWFFKALAFIAVGAVALVALWFVAFKPVVESTAQTVAEDHTAELAKAIVAASDKADQAQKDSAAAKDEAQAANSTSTQSEKKVDKAIGPNGTLTKTTPAPAGSLDPKAAIDRQINASTPVGVGFKLFSFPHPAKKVVWVSDLLLQNPNGDTGILRIMRGKTVLLEFGLQNFRDLDYHFIQPAAFTAADPFVVAVQCKNTTDACTPAVYFSGQALAAPAKAKQP